MKPWLSLLGALGVLVSGCTLLPSKPGAVIDGLMVTLRVNYAARIARVLQGEPVRLALEVVARNRARTIVLTRRPAYDFVVTTQGGMEVWRWSHGKTIEEIHKDMEVWNWQSSFDPRGTWD
ncbi:MAG: BsuPI-related putative proteinase inhibitor [Candidatus Bipolaricaulota bacterium]|nr:BsuPI-related putative proteinase inhibitor [Candidatus Bipolaricaulota bacterium]MDW8030784.1 BsuPI-related putative proteinase inhibitor [Candidatus Bipolaricaulota bacterium]